VNSHYQVVVGERRYRAAQQARLDTVPVVIKDYTDEELLEIHLVDNVQREDLSVVEKARLC
jgi:ParB family transcriptional regulator, chromosome partitioning protein